MTSLVVDASIAVKWLVFEEQFDEAAAVARSRNRLIAPRILLTEVANALVRRANRSEMGIEDALTGYGNVAPLFDKIVAINDLLPVAMRNAHQLRHPIYDLIYVELAIRRETRVVTADRRLANKLIGTPLARHIVLLSDWRPS